MSCRNTPEILGKTSEAAVATNELRPLDIRHCRGASAMPNHVGNIGSTESASNSRDAKILRAPNGVLTASIVRDLLDYDPDTGLLHWKHRPLRYCSSEQSQKAINARIAGRRAFTALNTGGYYQGAVLRLQVVAHRVIWLWMTGDHPADCIDHIDNNVLNNSWSNLREATRAQNQANRRSYKGSSSQYLGVTRVGKSWSASITSNYKYKRLGNFRCEVEAAKAYDAEAIRLHGEYANLNFPEAAS